MHCWNHLNHILIITTLKKNIRRKPNRKIGDLNYIPRAPKPDATLTIDVMKRGERGNSFSRQNCRWKSVNVWGVWGKLKITWQNCCVKAQERKKSDKDNTTGSHKHCRRRKLRSQQKRHNDDKQNCDDQERCTVGRCQSIHDGFVPRRVVWFHIWFVVWIFHHLLDLWPQTNRTFNETVPFDKTLTETVLVQQVTRTKADLDPQVMEIKFPDSGKETFNFMGVTIYYGRAVQAIADCTAMGAGAQL